MNTELLKLLGPDGEARAHFRASNGEWVDSFFDRVISEIVSVRAMDTLLQDLILKYGAHSANVVFTSDSRIQLNVRWDVDRGYTCYTADT